MNAAAVAAAAGECRSVVVVVNCELPLRRLSRIDRSTMTTTTTLLTTHSLECGQTPDRRPVTALVVVELVPPTRITDADAPLKRVRAHFLCATATQRSIAPANALHTQHIAIYR